MKIKLYFKRMIQYIMRGEEDKSIFVNIDSIKYGNILKDKNILITGGSSGIGLAIAKKCVQEGAKIIITGRNLEKLKRAQIEIGIECCEILQLEMNNIEKFDEAIEEMLKYFDGRIDMIVNNAGIYEYKKYFEYEEKDFERMFNINLKGVYFLTQKVTQRWVSNKQEGNVIMISSETGIIGDYTPYSLSKSALIHLTKGLAKELGRNNIRVNGIAPGVVISEISEYSSSYDPNGNLFMKSSRGKRILRGEEIAEVTVFLLSNASKCINGEIISCNEGNSIL